MNFESLIKKHNCEILNKVINKDPLSNSPDHLFMKCKDLCIHIPVSVFTNKPYWVEINGKIHEITTWEGLDTLLK